MVSLILGDNVWSRAAGIDVAQLPTDAYRTIVRPNAVFIAGYDDPKADPWDFALRGNGSIHFRRGTALGVYGFLDRYAHVRFYFAGEPGIVAPRRASLSIPTGDAVTEPAFVERSFSWYGETMGACYDETVGSRAWGQMKRLALLRMRFETQCYNTCHGLRLFYYLDRFAKEHPDYCVMGKDGKRFCYDPKNPPVYNRLCFSSPGLRDEIYADVKAYLTGQPASSRGLKRWKWNCQDGKIVDIGPEDGYGPCYCPACQAAYDKRSPKYATKLMWGFYRDIASRLKRDGIPGILRVAGEYGAWAMPDGPIPDNIICDASVSGPWAAYDEKQFAQEVDLLRRWYEKSGRKNLLWTYAGKFRCSGLNIPDLPIFAPRGYAKFYRAVRPYTLGPYNETMIDRHLLDAVNLYVLSKLSWDPDLDIEQLLAEGHRDLFGAGAPFMASFFDTLERLWTTRVARQTVDTVLGPISRVPSEYRRWVEIYSADFARESAALFDRAAAAVPAGSPEARRIALFRKELLEPLATKGAAYRENLKVQPELDRRAARKPVNLLRHPSFDSLKGWDRAGIRQAIAIDRDVTFNGRPTLRIALTPAMTNKPVTYVQQKFAAERGKSYRVSYFVRGENVRIRARNGGANAEFWFSEVHDRGSGVPSRHYLEGTFDWIHQSGIVTVPLEMADFDPNLALRTLFTTGTLWFAEPLVEELPGGQVRFKLDFDGTAEAKTPSGTVRPIQAGKLVYGPGRTGQAAYFQSGRPTPLAFDAKGILDGDCGSVSFWFKPEPAIGEPVYGNEDLNAEPWRNFFVTQTPKGGRHGSGQLWFWRGYYGFVRGDLSDDFDSFLINSKRLVPGEWNHLVYTWDRQKTQVAVNGFVDRSHRKMREFMKAVLNGSKVLANEQTFSHREPYETFEIGGGSSPVGGWIDDLEIRDAALGEEAILALYGRKPACNIPIPPDWAASPNRYEAPPLDVPGVPGEMELVDRITFDSPDVIERLKAANRWSVVGPTRFGCLAGTKYLELGTNREDRCGVRFKLDGKGPLYCFEIDYPDNAWRTVDFTVQWTKNQRQYPVPLAWHGGLNTYDYALQTGIRAGDEYRSSMRTLTHRAVYWAATNDVTLLAVTARPGEGGAAMSEVRVYRIASGRLPVAKVNPAPANRDGWHRTFGAWFEDPAIHYDFASEGFTLPKMLDQVERTCAWMKYTGYDILAYPFSWYPGVAGHNGILLRGAGLDYVQPFYARFDREGLGILPTMNLTNMAMPDSAAGFTTNYVTDGSAYATPATIDDTGKVPVSRRNKLEVPYNISHPGVQKEIEELFDILVREGRDHPSFRGVGLYIHARNAFTFHDEHQGYNDYTIEAFEKETGLHVVADRSDPLRGKAYAAWLRANAWEKWIDWRCQVVARFYKRLAAKLAAVRPDAKLVLNTWFQPNVHKAESAEPGYLLRRNRLAGIDPKLYSDTSNVSVALTITPSDYRHRINGVFANAPYDPVARAADRTRYLTADDYAYLRQSEVFPWLHQHERYWEDWEGLKALCQKKPTLKNEWLDESIWRVSVLNPAGRHALKFFAVPLGHCDMLAMTKGGYLVGTYGTEDVLVPFVQAFRALPAVKMADVAGGPGGVVMRHVEFQGKSYFYLVNVTDAPRTVSVEVPNGSVDLVTGERPGSWFGRLFGAKRAEITLDAYELRSFAADAGAPRW